MIEIVEFISMGLSRDSPLKLLVLLPNANVMKKDLSENGKHNGSTNNVSKPLLPKKEYSKLA